MNTQLYIEKRNTIGQTYPLQFMILKHYKRAGKVTVQDKGGSQPRETMKLVDFDARFAPVEL